MHVKFIMSSTIVVKLLEVSSLKCRIEIGNQCLSTDTIIMILLCICCNLQ